MKNWSPLATSPVTSTCTLGQDVRLTFRLTIADRRTGFQIKSAASPTLQRRMRRPLATASTKQSQGAKHRSTEATRPPTLDKVCSLASKFYPADFLEQERANLRCQLRHYELDVPTNPKFQDVTSVANLCRRLVETKKQMIIIWFTGVLLFYIIDT